MCAEFPSSSSPRRTTTGEKLGSGKPKMAESPRGPLRFHILKIFQKVMLDSLVKLVSVQGSNAKVWWVYLVEELAQVDSWNKIWTVLKYAALLIIPCSLSVSLSKTPISLFSQYSYVWNEYRLRYPISTKNCSKLNKKILQCQILKLTKISLALSLLAAEQTSNLDFDNVQRANKKIWTKLSANLNRKCLKESQQENVNKFISQP